MAEGIKICDGAGMLDVFSRTKGSPARHRAAGRVVQGPCKCYVDGTITALEPTIGDPPRHKPVPARYWVQRCICQHSAVSLVTYFYLLGVSSSTEQ